MHGYNLRKRSAPAKISYKTGAKVAKLKMKVEPIPLLYFDIIRDVLANFDRKTLCRLQIVNKHFSVIIVKEFNKTPPYLILRELNYANGQWKMKVGRGLRRVDPTIVQKIIASKFIRFKYSSIFCDEDFNPTQLLAMKHVWENRDMGVLWTRIKNFRPTVELNGAFSSCSELYVQGSNAISILDEISLGKCRELEICDDDYDPALQEVPWTKMNDFLFRSFGCPKARNDMYIKTDRPPNREKAMEFINSVKERFEATKIAVDFRCHWATNFEDETFPQFDVENNQTKQHLSLYSFVDGFTMYSSYSVV
ncbi:hypothetical protein DdX_20837 [Ditylenchus destructor]|uniref:F-box domain-containing protein n=1 Tax=Ditylenchus destructor TaxID=166010 RepID=A0AAD4QW20_9BILA|nr:hypothetical protein DdX_20837 [Ditylenchus destructor]